MNDLKFAFGQLLKNLGFTGVAVLTLAPGTASVHGAVYDWPMWRGTNHDGISREPGWLVTWPKDGPKELWRASIGTGFATVSVSQGRLFTGGNSNQTDTIYCLDSETGREVWKHSYACPVNIPQERFGPAATPTLDRDRVYTLSLEGHVFCFEAASGKILWSKQIAQELNARPPRWGFSGSPLAQGGLLILNVGSAGTALDKATGKVVWTSGRGPAGYASPVPFSNEGQPAVGIFAADALIALNPATGKELWRHAWKTDYGINVADPVFVGDKAFVASNYGKGCGLIQFHGSEAKLLWTNNNLHAHFSSPVFINGFLYAVDGEADSGGESLRCLDFNTGQVKWTEKLPAIASLMAADGKLVVMTGKGELMVAEARPESFKLLARAQVLGGRCWTPPVLANGRLYCRSAQGNLVCLDVKTTKL